MIDDHETYGPFGIHVAQDDRVPRDEAWLMPPVLRPTSATHRVVRRVAVDPAGPGPKSTVLYVELVHDRGDRSPLVIAHAYSAPGAGLPQLPPVTTCPHCHALVNADGRLMAGTAAPHWARPASWLRRWILDGRDDERQRVDMESIFAGLTQRASAAAFAATPPGPVNRAAHTAGRVCRTADDGRLRHPMADGLRRLQAQLSAERYIGAAYADPRSFARIHGLGG